MPQIKNKQIVIESDIDINGYKPIDLGQGSAIDDSISKEQYDSKIEHITSVDEAITLFDSTTGKVIKNAPITIDASNNLVLPSNAKLYIGGVDVLPSMLMPGTTWTQGTPTESIINIAYGNGIFVGITSGTTIITSPDGITWTNRTITADGSNNYVTFGAGLFVMVSYTGTDRIRTSPDGITWTPRTAPSVCAWVSVAYGGGRFVAVCNGAQSMYSTDGITWVAGGSASVIYNFGVTYGGDRFVAVGIPTTVPLSGFLAKYSTNGGVSWTEVTTTIDSSKWVDVCYGNGLFVAVSATGSTSGVITSPDGITWTARTTPVNEWMGVCYGLGLFVATGRTGTNRIMTSPDGITWTAITGVPELSYKRPGYGEGKFVAAATTGIVTSGE